MDPLSAALIIAGALGGLVFVAVMLLRASRTKLPLGQRPDGAPRVRRQKGVCGYCQQALVPNARRCGHCGARVD